MKRHPMQPTRRQAGAALAALALTTTGFGIGSAVAQSGTPITPEMLRRVPPPPKPDATLRIEVKPGIAPRDTRSNSAPPATPTATPAPAPR